MIDAMALMRACEQRFPISAWQADGVWLWPLLRVDWALSIQSRHGRPLAQPSIFARLLRRCAAMPPPMPAPTGPADIVVLSVASSLTIPVDAMWFDAFAGPVVEQACARGLTVAVLSHGHRGDRRRSRWPVEIIDGTLARSSPQPRTLDLPGFSLCSTWLADAAPGWSADRSAIAIRWARIVGWADALVRRLERLRPRLGLVVSWYGDHGLAFLLACQQLGIPTADLQHGVQSHAHPAYAPWPKSAPGLVRPLPDRCWCWRPIDAERLDSGGLWGGHPLLELAKRGHPALAVRCPSSDLPSVLVSLQPYADPWTPLAGIISRVGAQRRWLLRGHPCRPVVQPPAAVRRLAPLDVTRLPLPNVLRECAAHLTLDSSCAIEADLLGVPTVFASASAAPLYAELLDGGSVIAEDTDTAAAAVLAGTAHQRTAPSPPDPWPELLRR